MRGQFRILLIIPPAKTMYSDEPPSVTEHPHVGIAYLAAILKQNSINYEIIDMRLGYTYLKILEIIARALLGA